MKGRGGAYPDEGIPEKRGDPVERVLPLLDHALRQLHHRVGKPLVDRPLPVQDGADTDLHEPDGQDQGEPEGERFQPGAPGDRRPPRQPLVVMLDRGGILGRHPARDQVVEELGEAVLRGGVVEGVDHRAEEKEHQPPGRHGDGYQQHAVDHHQVRRRQLEPYVEGLQNDVEEQRDDDEGEDGRRRRGVEAPVDVLEHQPPGNQHSDGDTAGGTDQESLEGEV